MTGGHGGGGQHAPATHGPRWLALSTALVLGVAGILAGVTAWKGTVYQGHAVEYFTLSTQAVNTASALAQDSERKITGERQLFIEYQTALASGNEDGAAALLAMMSQSTRAAIAWWQGQPEANRPMSPFVSANPDWSAPQLVVGARVALEQANTYQETAEKDLDRAHTLELFAAFLTIAFLAGGFTGILEAFRPRVALLSVAAVVVIGCAVGTVVYW
jgi:hypothetical protein